ncbi:MAG TPA: hypothetical protein PKK12_05035 [Candidatus Aminicenantes bacterium]|nr:hypothetical protein [Candidatus Aminicenantes bacterium]
MNRGFTVIEGLVAMTLVLFSLTTLIGALVFGRHHVQLSRQRIAERVRLDSALTRLAVLPFADCELSPGVHAEAGKIPPVQWQVGLPLPGVKTIRVKLAGAPHPVQRTLVRTDSW